ncbi:MAG: S-layer homology domain-containing protein [Peptoniphilaceae bacterium]
MRKLISLFLLILILIPNTVFSKEYNDIDNHWAKKYITHIDKIGLIDGYENNKFLPDKFITKAESYKIINKLFGFTDMKDFKFQNIDDSQWFYEDLKKALAYGYIEDNIHFDNDYISRIEIINILGYLYDLEGDKSHYKYFLDIDDLNLKSKLYISKLLEDKVINGYTNYLFKPDNKITRGEFSKILSLCIEKYGRERKINDIFIEKNPSNHIIDEKYRKTIKEFEDLIEETKNIDLSLYTQESVSKLKATLLQASNLFENENLSQSEIIKLMDDIRDAKLDLKLKITYGKLNIITLDKENNFIDSRLFINNEEFLNGDKLKTGRYLLKVISPNKLDMETYVIMSESDKTLTFVLDDCPNKKFKLSLGDNISSLNGYLFEENSRVDLKINIPPGYKIDNLFINGKKKKVLDADGEYSFIIKQDSEVNVSFVKDNEE